MTTKPKPPATAWRPGQSGNPSGRPPGIPNPSARLRRLIDVEGLLRKLHALPPLRATAEAVCIPDASAAGSLTEYAEAVMRATAAGEVAPDVAASLLGALGQLGRLRELDELERRLAALEKDREA